MITKVDFWPSFPEHHFLRLLMRKKRCFNSLVLVVSLFLSNVFHSFLFSFILPAASALSPCPPVPYVSFPLFFAFSPCPFFLWRPPCLPSPPKKQRKIFQNIENEKKKGETEKANRTKRKRQKEIRKTEKKKQNEKSWCSTKLGKKAT